MEEQDREMSLEEEVELYHSEANRLRETLAVHRLERTRYLKLRDMEVIIMAEDGAKYLKGVDLDKYLDNIPQRPLTSKRIADEALKILESQLRGAYK